MQQEKEDLDFQEILPIFLPEQAVREADRCLYCFDAPCMKRCPAEIDIPHFIQSIRTQNFKRASRLINDENPFGSVCGRVCPTERLCEENCSSQYVTGTSIEIGRLQAFAMEYGDYTPEPAVKRKSERVAVIGAGPAGLTCARELVRNGYHATVFESKKTAGGMVAFGVPQYRCSHDVTAGEVKRIANEGVEILTATPFNQEASSLLKKDYDAVFVAIGLTKTSRPEIPGLDLKGVYMGLDFLSRIGSGDNPEVGRRVVVVGGGDTALDCARSALRLGAESVTLMYRRSFTELPAEQAQIEEALAEGIIFRTLTQPISLVGDDKKILRAVEVVSMKLGNPDPSGRRSPEMIKGSEHRLACNTMIFATGFVPSALLKRMLAGAEFDGPFPKVDPDTLETTIPGIFCGGDIVNGGATVVEAVAHGKSAARSIIRYLEESCAIHEDRDSLEEQLEARRLASALLLRAEEEIVQSFETDSVESVDEEVDSLVESGIESESVDETLSEPEVQDEEVVNFVEASVVEVEIEPSVDSPEAEVVEAVGSDSEEDEEIARQREEMKKKWKEKASAKKSTRPKSSKTEKPEKAEKTTKSKTEKSKKTTTKKKKE